MLKRGSTPVPLTRETRTRTWVFQLISQCCPTAPYASKTSIQGLFAITEKYNKLTSQ